MGGYDIQEVETQLTFSSFNCSHLQNVQEYLYKLDSGKKIVFKQIDNITTESTAISSEAQILTANASILTPENITSATRVVGQIFNESRRAEQQVKLKILRYKRKLGLWSIDGVSLGHQGLGLDSKRFRMGRDIQNSPP